MSHFATPCLICFVIASYLSSTSAMSIDSDWGNTTNTPTWTTTSTFTRKSTALATTASMTFPTMTPDNNSTSTTTTTTVTSTTSTGGLAHTMASAVNAILLTDIVLHTATILAGVTMIAIGQKVPILLAGSLVLAIFVGMLTKTGQDANSEASQWVFWPSIVAVSSFIFLSVLIKFFRNIMVSVITGILLATLGVTLTVSATLPVWSFKSFPKEFPWGVAVGAVLYVCGHEVARKTVEHPLLYKFLSAFIGGFLIAHGSLFFLHGRDFAEEVSNAMVRAATNSEEDRSHIADEVRLQVAGWLGISVGLFLMRFAVKGIWHKYKPQRFHEKEEHDASCEDCSTGDLEKGAPESLRSELHQEEEKPASDDRVWAV